MKSLGITLLMALLLGVVGVSAASGSPQALGGAEPPGQTEEEMVPWIGISLANLNEDLAARLGIDLVQGVVVVRVAEDGPAAQAGMLRGDIVTAIGDQAISNVEQVIDTVRAWNEGSTPLIFTVARGTETLTLSITPVLRPKAELHPLLRPMHPRQPPLLGGLRGLLGRVSLDRFVRAEVVFEGKDGELKTITAAGGSVVSAGDGMLVVSLKDGSGEATFAIGDTTPIVQGRDRVQLEDLDAGVAVIVVSVDGEVKLVVVASLDYSAPYNGPVPHMMPHRGGGFMAPPQVMGPGMDQIQEVMPELRERLSHMMERWVGMGLGGPELGRRAPQQAEELPVF